MLIRSPVLGDFLVCNNGCGYRIYAIENADDKKERPQSSLLDFK